MLYIHAVALWGLVSAGFGLGFLCCALLTAAKRGDG